MPVLPLRINFVLYIRDFISSLATQTETKPHPTLIDLGCGPIAIVSVLAHRLFKWNSILVEPNQTSAQLAAKNLAQNGMNCEIFSQGENLLPIGLDASKSYVVASNPPWFEGEDNHERERTGGEVDFAKRLIKEYLSQDNILAVCLLIGKKDNYQKIIAAAKDANLSTYCIKMDQGQKCRYFVAWSKIASQINQVAKRRNVVKQPGKKTARPLRGSVRLTKAENNLTVLITDYFKRLNVNYQTLLVTENEIKYKIKASQRTWPKNRSERKSGIFQIDTIDITAVVEVRIENDTNVQLLLHGNNSEEEINFLQSLTRMIQEDIEKSKTAK